MKISQNIKDFFFILCGSFLMAIGYAVFIAPNNIVPGGVYGISIVVNHLTRNIFSFASTGLPLGVVSLCLNVPLFLLALRNLGRFSAGKTVVTFLLIALFTDLISYLAKGHNFVGDDVLLASFYGGALLGISVFLIFKAQSTCAGTDTLSRVISKKRNYKISNIIITIDSAIVMLGLIAFGDWRVPLYSWITIFIYGKVVDILQPQNTHKSVFIISEKTQEIRDAIIEMGMRGTFIHGKGMYEGKDREIIYIIVERKDLLTLKTKVMSVDPKAFVSSNDASQDSMPKLI